MALVVIDHRFPPGSAVRLHDGAGRTHPGYEDPLGVGVVPKDGILVIDSERITAGGVYMAVGYDGGHPLTVRVPGVDTPPDDLAQPPARPDPLRQGAPLRTTTVETDRQRQGDVPAGTTIQASDTRTGIATPL
jgi:hypothetical protein